MPEHLPPGERETRRLQREALGATVRQMRQRARRTFVADVDALIHELREFADAAGGALGEISVREAWDGIERIVRQHIPRGLQR